MKTINDYIVTEEEQKTYDSIIETLQESKNNNIPIEEGLVKALLGGVAGAALGPSVMKALCRALGVQPDGALYKFLTSSAILGGLCGYMGWKN